MIYWPAKAPGEVEDFEFDFSAVLQSGETIASKAPVADGVTIDSSAYANGNTAVRLWLSGGAAGAVATVTCTIVTSDGRTFAEVAVLPIGDEVVSVASMKAWLRVDADDASEDGLISELIADAVDMVEGAISKNLTPKIETQTVDGFGFPAGVPQPFQPWPAGGFAQQAIRLYKGPVSQVISIAYDDPQGVEQALTSFRLVEGVAARLLPAAGALWPLALAGAGTVRIAYLAGFAPGERPRKLERAVRMLVAHWYQNREAVVSGDRAAAVELPLAVSDILDMHRSPGIA